MIRKIAVSKPCLVRCEQYVYILLYLMSKLFPAYQKNAVPPVDLSNVSCHARYKGMIKRTPSCLTTPRPPTHNVRYATIPTS